jgi:putative SOS response-associated peptidase YedK
MCGRTSLFLPLADLEDYFGATAVGEIRPRLNINPGENLSTIQNDRRDEID